SSYPSVLPSPQLILVSFFLAPSPAVTSTLSLHDALPICRILRLCRRFPGGCRLDGRVRRDRLLYPHRSRVRKLSRREGITPAAEDRKSTRLNSSHVSISYAVFCLKKKKHKYINHEP